MPIVLIFSFTVAAADLPLAPPLLKPDARFKTDALLVVAHPDDDTAIGGYLARITLDERKRVAVVYCTNGDGGGNAIGPESSLALGRMRQIEARRALAVFGIENVWFLGASDTPGQDVLRSLENWNHGRVLDEVVRIVRITRPEVILTFLPQYVYGENHGDHQAAGVIGSEAFDMAGDPTQFPAQVSPAGNPHGIGNLTEGLQVWQPKKLYYFTDAFEDFGPYWHDKEDISPHRKHLSEGRGPSYPNTRISPSRKESYASLAAKQLSVYASQGDGEIGSEALAKKDLSGFEFPTRFILGKSVAGGSVTDDVFANLPPGPAVFARVAGYEPRVTKGLSLELAGPWMFYRDFWKAHNLQNLADLVPVPESAVDFGDTLRVPLLIRNGTNSSQVVTLTPVLPAGWTNKTRYGRYQVDRGAAYPVQGLLVAPPSGKRGWQEVSWNTETGGRELGSVTMRVYVGKTGGLPQ